MPYAEFLFKVLVPGSDGFHVDNLTPAALEGGPQPTPFFAWAKVLAGAAATAQLDFISDWISKYGNIFKHFEEYHMRRIISYAMMVNTSRRTVEYLFTQFGWSEAEFKTITLTNTITLANIPPSDP